MVAIFIIGKNGEFAKDGREIYDCPEDKKHFQNFIRGKLCVVGNRTYQTLPESVKRLAAVWYIYTSNEHVDAINQTAEKNIVYFNDMSLLTAIEKMTDEVRLTSWICIGGAKLIEDLVDYDLIHRMIVTEVNKDFLDADTYIGPFTACSMEYKPPVKEEKLENTKGDDITIYTYDIFE